MNIEAMTKWIEALEDPANEKRQIKGRYGDGADGVCALGLLYELNGINPHDQPEAKVMPYRLLHWGEGDVLNPTTVKVEDRYFAVHTLNDSGWPFWGIAQALRATHLKDEG